MSQPESIIKLHHYPYPDSFRMVDRSKLSLSRCFFSPEAGEDSGESEDTAKTDNPEYMKEMGILYRTTEATRPETKPDSFLNRLISRIKK